MAIHKLCAHVIGAAVVLAGCAAAQAEPLLIGHSIWVGWGPLFVAQEKGFFVDEGVDVQTVNLEKEPFAVLYDGHVDALAVSFDTAVAWFDPDQKPLCVLALDDSIGGDGIAAMTEIENADDLKGRTIAFSDLSVSQFYLHVVLREAGLRDVDIVPVPLSPQDAVEAFLLGEVDAVVTWEPWLTESVVAAHGHLLEDSSERPGLIVDCLVTTAAAFERRKSDFRAVARGWAAAVDFYEAHPEAAIEIMARHVGGWLEDPAAFAEALEGVRLYGREANRTYFGTPGDPGAIYGTAAKAIDVWTSIGRLEADVSPADVVGHGIWD